MTGPSRRSVTSSPGRRAASRRRRAARPTTMTAPSTSHGAGTHHSVSTPTPTDEGGHPPGDHYRGVGHGGEQRVEHGVGGHALELGLVPQPDPVPQRRPGHRLHVVGRDVVAARSARRTPWPRAAGRWRRAATRRARTTGRSGSPGTGRRCTRARRRRPGRAATPAPGRGEVGGAGHRPHAGGRRGRAGRSRGGGARSTPSSSSRLGQRHGELEQEAVELRLGQRVGALVLDRVLGGGDQERVGQRVRVARRPRPAAPPSPRAGTPGSWAASG